MDQHVHNLINSLSPRPQRSRLGPYAELIDEMRKRGWTYRAIAKLLAESCGLRVSPSNIHYFVRTVRAKDQSTCKQQPILEGIGNVPADRMTATESDVNARIAALKSRTPQLRIAREEVSV